ncbi:hypothetical protein LCGC14_1451450 [marine sediment metagenome]|uniref:Uncharacterized protein n=1 Tax=marine sediment metagenome TaxID=412755 RepID=A0A0F9LYG2_9ZZZZ
MKVEIIFHSSSTPKKIKDVESIYTKGALLCVQLDDGLIIKYPLLNIFSVAHYHGTHLGTNKADT